MGMLQRPFLTSVKARVTVITLAIFVTGAVVLGVHMARVLRADVQSLIAAQQFSASQTLASVIEDQIQERFLAMGQAGRRIGPQMAQGPTGVQQTLETLAVFQNYFNGGIFVTDTRGIAVAAWPASVPRVGLDFSDRDYVQAALVQGRAIVGRPTVGRVLGVPVVTLAIPLRDDLGRIVGVLCGTINLSQPSFLDNVHHSSFGKTGILLLVSTRDRLVVTASDKRRVMEALPEPGVNPAIDRFLAGSEGTTILTNPLGVEVLSSIKQIPTAGWYLAISMPTEEAFEPANALERRMVLGLVVLTLLGGGLTWWVIRSQLSPLGRAARSVTAIAQAPGEIDRLEPLPVQRPDEIGQLIMAFNHLMLEIDRQRATLAHSKTLYSTVFQTIPDVVTLARVHDGRCLAINAAFSRVFGWREEEAVGQTSATLGLWRRPDDRRALVQLVERRGRCDGLEAELVTRDGKVLSVEISASLMEVDGERCLLCVTHDITARKQAQRQIETLAFTDPLTGLPNRRLLIERIGRALAEAQPNGKQVGLIFIDLDDFKQINDSQGHEAGDKLLRSLAGELRSVVPLSDTVARMGGDEFVVLLCELPGGNDLARAAAEATAHALLKAIARGYARLGRGFHGSGSVGVALSGTEALDTQDLMRHADLAMYHAKEGGTGQIRLFEPWMLAQLSSRAEMEASLRAALGTDQFFLVYQPQIGPGGRVEGVEALVRWRHPDKGVVAPAEFIPLAERSGLIMPLGREILRTACQQLAQWAQDPAMASLRVSVNVSSLQFQQPDFIEQVRTLVQTTGVNPQRLVLELTESLLVDQVDGLVARMQALKALGVGFSLDDFGTGFSSLSYLQRLPLDELKIDASFVRALDDGPHALAIARMIVALGDTLGLRVLAEGVETEAQRGLLAGIGCAHYQGYLFGRPESALAVQARVRGPQPAPTIPS